MKSIIDQLKAREPKLRVTYVLIGINVIVFLAMYTQGAALFNPSNAVPLAWGANFAPATQDGQWWRLGAAMFIHFGVLHLGLNSFALWDVGQFTERMYGPWRLLGIYLISGLVGNILSLDVQGNDAVSGGASGAIFGLYGALLVYLWRERNYIHPKEFKWLFGGAVGFAVLAISLGFIVTGIDNAAHIGGFVAGLIGGIVFAKPMNARIMPMRFSIGAFASVFIVSALLINNLPPPKYKWSEELLLQDVIGDVIFQSQESNRNWLGLIQQSKQGDQSFEDLAGKIDTLITSPYGDSFEKLSKLPQDPDLPSAEALQFWLELTEKEKNKSAALADGLRKRQH